MAVSDRTEVLSEALQQAIDGRRVKSAVFTTFNFDPGFFEEEILPLLFDFSSSHVPKLRRIQLEEELRAIDHLAVYYDRRALETSGGSASLDYRRIPLARKGFFHPKVVLVLVEEEDDDGGRGQSLVVGVFSANLTRSGWWENLECAVIEVVDEGHRCRFRKDLLELLGWIRRSDKSGAEHRALEEIRKFVHYKTEELPQRTRSGRLLPRIFCGQEGLSDYLAKVLRLPEDALNLEVISPYFQDGDDARVLSELVGALRPKETRVFLPRKDDGTAECTDSFFKAVCALPNTSWAKLPNHLRRRSASSQEDDPARFVHAKVYRLWSKSLGLEILVTGSVNLTGAAHSRAAAGNLEAAFVTETEPGEFRPRFWLEPIEDDSITSFEKNENTEEPDDVWFPPVTILYDWEREEGRYFWESEVPETFAILSAGAKLGTVTGCTQGEWVHLPPVVSAMLGKVLTGTSFLEIRVEGYPAGTILVREEGMARKPSLLLSLTPEEILRYWSLLSTEQREIFLAQKANDLLVREGLLSEHAATQTVPESMFDQFAGIFHAFSSMVRQIEEGLDGGTEREAVYRLFGSKYDSLPNLIDKVLEEEDGDLVNRYITLLTARQSLRRLRKSYPDFFEKHGRLAAQLENQLRKTDKLRARFDFEGPRAQKQFLDWYERIFLAQAKEERASRSGS